MGPKIRVEDHPEPGPEPEPKPKAKTRTTRPKKRGPVTDEHITAWTIQLFSIAAMFRGKHWNIHDPEDEVGPWAGSAADLINEHVDADMAEKALALNAGVAVAVGIGSLVMVRMQEEYKLKQETVMLREAAARRPGTGHPQEVGTPRQAVTNEDAQNVRVMRNGGAAPANPEESLFGTGTNYGVS